MQEVAIACDVTPAAVTKWENGTSLPRWKQRRLLAQFFNMAPDEMQGVLNETATKK